jgi:hypothetical protein
MQFSFFEFVYVSVLTLNDCAYVEDTKM